MNAKHFILSGVVATGFYLATSSQLAARGLVLRPAPASADTNAAPGQAQPPPNGQQDQGAPEGQGPIILGHPDLGSTNGPAASQGEQRNPMPVNRASHLIGMTVKNQKNETLGKITDVVVDFKTSRVPYLVLAKSGRNHGGNGQLAVPLSHFTPSDDRKTLTLNADRAQIEHATGFAGDNLPAMNNPAFGAEPETPRREILIIPVPVRPKGQNQDQDQNPDQQDQHDSVPPHLHKGPAIQNP